MVSRLDHDADIRPWVQAAEAVGATVRWVDFEPDSKELPPAGFAAVLSARTRLGHRTTTLPHRLRDGDTGHTDDGAGAGAGGRAGFRPDGHARAVI